MPNVRSQTVETHGLTIVASDGRSATVTRGQLRALFERQKNGDREQRRRGFSQGLRALLAQELGEEQMGALEADIDEADGRPVRMEIAE